MPGSWTFVRLAQIHLLPLLELSSPEAYLSLLIRTGKLHACLRSAIALHKGKPHFTEKATIALSRILREQGYFFALS
jgi:hypothetical protein